jgi:signal transduction histidine kinase
MRHELRTPINGIVGYSELMLEEAEDEGDGTAVADLEAVRAAGRELLGLVNGLLAASRLDTNPKPTVADIGGELRQAVQAPVETVLGACDRLAAAAAARGLDGAVEDADKIRTAAKKIDALAADLARFTAAPDP